MTLVLITREGGAFARHAIVAVTRVQACVLADLGLARPYDATSAGW